jgi:hypothetical protein
VVLREKTSTKTTGKAADFHLQKVTGVRRKRASLCGQKNTADVRIVSRLNFFPIRHYRNFVIVLNTAL